MNHLLFSTFFLMLSGLSHAEPSQPLFNKPSKDTSWVFSLSGGLTLLGMGQSVDHILNVNQLNQTEYSWLHIGSSSGEIRYPKNYPSGSFQLEFKRIIKPQHFLTLSYGISNAQRIKGNAGAFHFDIQTLIHQVRGMYGLLSVNHRRGIMAGAMVGLLELSGETYEYYPKESSSVQRQHHFIAGGTAEGFIRLGKATEQSVSLRVIADLWTAVNMDPFYAKDQTIIQPHRLQPSSFSIALNIPICMIK